MRQFLIFTHTGEHRKSLCTVHVYDVCGKLFTPHPGAGEIFAKTSRHTGSGVRLLIHLINFQFSGRLAQSIFVFCVEISSDKAAGFCAIEQAKLPRKTSGRELLKPKHL